MLLQEGMLHWRCVHNSCFVLCSKKQEGSSSLVSFWICKAPCQTFMLLQEEILLANGGQLPAIGSVLGKFVRHLLMNHLFGCCLDYYEI